MEPKLRGTASHEIYLTISTRPMDMVTLNFKKTPSLKDSLYDKTGQILHHEHNFIENSKQDGGADINSISDDAITLTYGPMRVEFFQSCLNQIRNSGNLFTQNFRRLKQKFRVHFSGSFQKLAIRVSTITSKSKIFLLRPYSKYHL